MPLYLLLTVVAAAESSTGPEVQPGAEPGRITVSVPLPAALRAQPAGEKISQDAGERWLRLALVDMETRREGPAILGRYERRGDTLVFTPRHPLAAGGQYRATFTPAAGPPVSSEYRVPAAPPGAPLTVEHLYPTGPEVPANLLKFYVHFSRPIRAGRDVFDHFHLRMADGTEVPDPWRRTELWSDDGKRLTLWVHPGRVKEGVNLREDLGPVLEPDREYTLAIDAHLADTAGQPLGREFTRKYRAIAAEHSRVRAQDWTVRAPAAGTRAPLMLTFPRPLDRALLDRMLVIRDGRGETVAGRIEVAEAERKWSFRPNRPWTAGEYIVAVDGRLEDLAGNTPLRIFDLDLRRPDAEAAVLSLSFTAAPGRGK
jgi:hypothetical protein